MRYARLSFTVAPFILGIAAWSSTASAQTAAGDPPKPVIGGVELLSLRIMHDKGILSDAEYESALSDMNDTTGLRGADQTSVVVGKWATTLYGFVEADSIFDSTESFNDLAGNAQVARSTTYAGSHPRMQFSGRNSRLGFRMKAPEVNRIRVSAVVETDFMGNQSLGYATGQASENQYFTSPLLRIRHMYLKAETPVVDVLLGQTWDVFGWQSVYHPNTVEIQGVPGEIYSRTPQIRLSKSINGAPVTVEIVAAAMRPPQRDSAWPEGQGGVRLALNGWTGVRTAGATGTSIDPLSIAFTGDLRRVEVPQYLAAPTSAIGKTATAGAIDAFVPVLPGRKGKMGNSLSLNGEFASGYGTADLYTGLTGGVPISSAPATTPAWAQDIDTGIVTYTSTGELHYVQWTSYLLGAQYYLPGLNGRAWVSGNFSHMETSNAGHLVPAASITKVRGAEDWWDVNLFGDVTPALRLGLEYAQFIDHYLDGNSPTNHRVQLSGFFIF